MFEQMIIEQGSPTLAGLKTANLFPCRFVCKKQLWANIRDFNRTLSHKGIRLIPVRIGENSALLYLYRPSKLERDLQNELAAQLLRRFGYKDLTPCGCITELMKRLKDNGKFPHEIGLFLGYPPEDVEGFVENGGACCKCVGCWKVYGDECLAKKKFANFKKCSRVYAEQFSKGKSIERLTVAV